MKLDRYHSIGCYPLFYIVEGWKPLCACCAEKCDDDVEQAVNWEDANLFCDECSNRIESAYNEPESEEVNNEVTP